MKLTFSSIKEFVKKRKKLTVISSIVLILVILVIAKVSASKNAKPNFEYYTVSKGSVTQEVDVTGKVKPAEAIDFAFETSGKVASVKVKVGDKVQSGAVLATLKNNDYSASIAQASAGVDAARSVVAQYQAQLDAQKVKLDELKRGSTSEDIQLTQIRIDSAKQSVESAKKSLENTKSQFYIDCANTASSAVNVGLNTLKVITDIQYAHFNGNDMEASILAGNKALAVSALVGGQDAGRWIFQYINNMNSGARGSALTAQSTSNEINDTKALIDVNDALNKIKMTLNAIPFDVNKLTTIEMAGLTLERSNIDIQISLVSAKINSGGTLNTSVINSAQTVLDQAQNNLSLAEQEMAIKKAGATSEQIAVQEAAVKQAESALNTQNAQVRSAQASLASASAMYFKTVLATTIAGTVTKVGVKAGEIASGMTPAISVMSDAKFGIEANVPEADITKIKPDNTAKVTLDAYSSDVTFDAKVAKIDPAETVVEGVSTYKVTFEFVNDDERIKSGLTANITILTAKKDDALIIPQRSLIKKDGKNFVLITEDERTTKEVEIEIGLVGSDGNVELVSGLNEGSKIVNPSSIKK